MKSRRAGDVTSRKIKFDRGPPTDPLSMALARIVVLEARCRLRAHLHREALTAYKKQLEVARDTAATLRKQMAMPTTSPSAIDGPALDDLAPLLGDDAFTGPRLFLGPDGVVDAVVSVINLEGDPDLGAGPTPMDALRTLFDDGRPPRQRRRDV